MRTYLDILADRRIAALLAAAFVSRLPITINGLAIMLFLRAELGSFSVAGAVAGALALGTGVGAPLMGRLVDRRGTRVLPPLAAGNAAGLLSLVALGEAHAPTVALMGTAAATGALYPPNLPVLRAQFPSLLRDRPRLISSAYALDTVLLELTFVAGPLLTAAIVAALAPAAALLVSAAAIVAGTLSFCAALPAAGPPPRAERRDLLGPLRSPGIQTLVLTMLPVGFAIGAFEVMLPAFAEGEGASELAGVLLACWSAGSAAGGLVYGARVWNASVGALHLRFTLALPFAFVPALAGSSVWLMALLVLPAGVLLAPIIATRNQLTAMAAPPGAQTEALTWPLTALLAGLSLGAGVAGALVDAADWHAAAYVAIAAAALSGLLATGRRHTLLSAGAAEAGRLPAPAGAGKG